MHAAAKKTSHGHFSQAGLPEERRIPKSDAFCYAPCPKPLASKTAQDHHLERTQPMLQWPNVCHMVQTPFCPWQNINKKLINKWLQRLENQCLFLPIVFFFLFSLLHFLNINNQDFIDFNFVQAKMLPVFYNQTRGSLFHFVDFSHGSTVHTYKMRFPTQTPHFEGVQTKFVSNRNVWPIELTTFHHPFASVLMFC